MAGARALRMAPRKIADALVANIDLAGSYFVGAEAAGPGFINFRLGPAWYGAVLSAVEREGADYGRSEAYKGRRVMVEFVSANPTGPMHMGNARGGVLGDTLAEVLSRVGADVWREFYVNDAGNQIEKFATSIDARYRQLILGEDAVEFPEDGYHGDDIKDLAAAFREKFGDAYLEKDERERHEAMAAFGLERNLPKMKSDLERYGIKYDEWFRESSLHESGYVADTVAELTRLGHTYEKDGALWLHTLQNHRGQAPRRREEREGHREARPQGRRPAPRERHIHLFRRRHRLPPQQARRAQFRHGHQHLGRRPPLATSPGSPPRSTRWASTASTGS